MSIGYVGPHWSATRFMTFEQCPGEFKARYLDERPVEVSEAMAFGTAVHMGLEAHYQGLDGELAFRHAWKQATHELADVNRSLTATGLELLDKVFELGLSGSPEHGFLLDTEAEIGAPIVGAIDLWGDDGVVYDFKTTRGTWSQHRAQTEVWQPVLYTWARWEQEPAYEAAFEYIVCNRVTGAVDRFRREWTPDEWVAQWNDVQGRMWRISRLVAAGYFECHGKHGYCPECGERWAHDHVCDAQVVGRLVRL